MRTAWDGDFSALSWNARTSVPNGTGPPPRAWTSSASSESLLVIDTSSTVGFASQVSLKTTVAVIGTSLWFGGHRLSGDRLTLSVGAIVSCTVTCVVAVDVR